MANYYGKTIEVETEFTAFISEVKDSIMELINKFLTPEQILESPDLAYVMGKAMIALNKGIELSEKMVRQMDQINDRVANLEDIEKSLDRIEEKLEKLEK